MEFQGYFIEVELKEVSGVFQECFMSLLRKFKGCFKSFKEGLFCCCFMAVIAVSRAEGGLVLHGSINAHLNNWCARCHMRPCYAFSFLNLAPSTQRMFENLQINKFNS